MATIRPKIMPGGPPLAASDCQHLKVMDVIVVHMRERVCLFCVVVDVVLWSRVRGRIPIETDSEDPSAIQALSTVRAIPASPTNPYCLFSWSL